MHSLWNDPPSTDPMLIKQAHRLMLQTLMKIEARVPSIFNNPAEAGGERTMLAAIAALQNPKIDSTLRLAALSRLQNLMHEVDPKTPQRLFLNRPEWLSPISKSIGHDLDRLSAFESALANYIRGPYTKNLSEIDSDVAALLNLGVLLALVVTRLGHCQQAVLSRFTEAICEQQTVTAYGPWAWIDLELSTTGSPELRRIFLTPVVLACMAQMQRRSVHLKKPKESAKRKARNRHYQSLANAAFRTFSHKLKCSGTQSPIGSLSHLREAVVQRLRVVTTPLLATYSEGGIRSSSLEIGTWCRLIGAIPNEPPTEPRVRDDSELRALPQAVAVADEDLPEQMASGDLITRGTIPKLRIIMDLPRTEWAHKFDQTISDLGGIDGDKQTEALVVSWLHHLAFKRKSEGKPLKDGTIRNYRGLLANRLIEILPPRLDSLTDDEIEGFYNQILESRHSPPQEGRIRSALASFDQFIRSQIPDLPEVPLQGFSAVSYDVSARIISEEEYFAGLAMIDSGSIALPESDDSANKLRAFWTLSFRFGLRRHEALGLRVKDVHDEYIDILAHAVRDLKTSNARRRIPIGILGDKERFSIAELKKNKTPDDFLFFSSGQSINRKSMDSHSVVLRTKDLLFRVTGDPHIHGHNLRHSAATLPLFGLLAREIGLRKRPYTEPWMESAVLWSYKLDSAISGELHRHSGRGNALAMVLGHGSEKTTFEHYTHCFDLVLFAATWPGTFTKAKRDPYSYLTPNRPERAILMRLLGLKESSFVSTTHMPTLIRRIARQSPGSIQLLEPRMQTDHSTDSATPMHSQISLGYLRALKDHQMERGYPEKQTDRDAVATFCKHLNEAIGKDLNTSGEILSEWVSKRRKNSDAASFSRTDAARFIDRTKDIMPDVCIEVSRHYNEGSKRTKLPFRSIGSGSDLDRGPGIFLLRFGESRPKKSRRPSNSGSNRSHSQPSMTWAIVVVSSLLSNGSANLTTT